MDPLRQAALETCENLMAPGKKWRLSPYLQPALARINSPEWVARIPVYQSVMLDLLAQGQVPASISMLEVGSPSGLGTMAVVDVLLAWQTVCALYRISPGIDHFETRLGAQQQQQEQAHLLWNIFREGLAARSGQLPALNCLAAGAEWAGNIYAKATTPPNLILWAFPWKESEKLEGILDRLPEETVLVGLEWPLPDTRPEAFRWRREFLEHHPEWVALGPCGQEYGRQLPENCLRCLHGRGESLHPGHYGKVAAMPPAWSYALLSKRATPVETPPPAQISAQKLSAPEIDALGLRYIGTFKEKNTLADHPAQAVDDPTDEKWSEYLKVCPGQESGVGRVAIERRAGMQTPPLRYGQWLPLRRVRPTQPYQGHPEVFTLNVRDETAFITTAALPVPETYLKSYDPGVRAAVDEAAYRLFGFPSLRPFQHTVLERVLTGRDILAIAATGGGKSECFILPALLLPGLTVVISPLKSLILDQYEQRIRDRYGLDHLSTFINGDVPFYDRHGRLRRMVLGHYKLIYMTPEQLERSYVLDALRQADEQVGVRYLALDEAHCVSQWGHDFRPSYLNIIQRLQAYGLTPCRIALTATASPLVRDDICDELHLDKSSLTQGGDVFIDSSNRPELNLVVKKVTSTVQKAEIIVQALRQLNGAGSAIVFLPHTGGPVDKPYDLGAPASRPNPANAGMVSPGVTAFAQYLRQHISQPIAIYHGALDDEAPARETAEAGTEDTLDGLTRQAEQRAFISGQKPVMVATKGFGMGIDKPDIRLVIHRTPPANLEAYAQEAGRAGRDQQPATVMLLLSDDQPHLTPVDDRYLSRTVLPSDREIQQYFIEQKYVRRQDVQAMLAFLRSEVPRRVNKALYFTNDQVMAAFEKYQAQPALAHLSAPYSWPVFPPRRRSGTYESPDHARILERGHQYYQKTQHLNRILAVLFNHRPLLNGQVWPVVETANEVGAMARKLRLYDPERIVNAATYFGEYLRQAGVAATDLRYLLPDNEVVDLLPLAKRLNLSLRETVSMLKDIRYCQGHTDRAGRWLGTLLNFWWIEAPRWMGLPDPYTNPSAWRDYAGARRRARPNSGGKSLDDYFPPAVVNSPLGWEVTPGPGLAYPDQTGYLDAFMTLHDDRRRNDEDNFAYLLNRYIGDGGGKECLRSLLLGYLKTNEVVVGGNCFGCSVCVPDLNFHQYSLAQRQAAVTRLLNETIALFDTIETHSRQTPSPDLLAQTVAMIEREDREGRSGTAYLDSWLARVIQDDPQHQGALWLRLTAGQQGVLSLSPRDTVTTLDRLARLTREPARLPGLSAIIEACMAEEAYTEWRLTLTVASADLAQHQKQWLREAERWHTALALLDRTAPDQRDNVLQYRALERLFELYRQEPLTNTAQSMIYGLRLARSPETSSARAVEVYAHRPNRSVGLVSA
jgi:ATP-dependent DNA helicase RecQ